MNRLSFVFAAGCWLFLGGCELNDSERCRNDLEWDSTVKLCHAKASEDDTGTTGAVDSDETDAAGDAGDPSVPFGTPCTEDANCGGETDFCLINPLAPTEPGVCTRLNCGADDCPASTFQCCDCTSLGSQVACVPEADVATAEMFGCSCS